MDENTFFVFVNVAVAGLIVLTLEWLVDKLDLISRTGTAFLRKKADKGLNIFCFFLIAAAAFCEVWYAIAEFKRHYSSTTAVNLMVLFFCLATIPLACGVIRMPKSKQIERR